MATAALGFIGKAAGSYLAGPVGGFLGGALGTVAGEYLDSKLFAAPTKTLHGPRAGDLNVQAASYGYPLARTHGTYMNAGNVIWAKTPIEEIASTTTQKTHGKGSLNVQKTRVTTYNYYVSFAVAIAEGPIAEVRRIWADGKLLVDNTLTPSLSTSAYQSEIAAVGQTAFLKALNAGATPTLAAYSARAYVNDSTAASGTKPGASGIISSIFGKSSTTSANRGKNVQQIVNNYQADGIRCYLGDEAQLPDPALEADIGTGLACPFRGTAYIVFDRLLVNDFSFHIPNITVEYSTVATVVVTPTAYATLDTGFGAPDAKAAPIALPASKWAVIGESGGRFCANIYAVGSDGSSGQGITQSNAADGTNLTLVSQSLGPVIQNPGFSSLTSAASPGGDYIGAVARDTDGGTAHVARYDVAAGQWAAGDCFTAGLVLNDALGNEMIWVGPAICTRTSLIADAGGTVIWHYWSPDMDQGNLIYRDAVDHNIYALGSGGLYGFLYKNCSWIPSDTGGSVVFYDANSSTAGNTVTCMPFEWISDDPTTGAGHIEIGEESDLFPGLTHAGTQQRASWVEYDDGAGLLMVSRADGGAPWLATVSIAGGEVTVTRLPWAPPVIGSVLNMDQTTYTVTYGTTDPRTAPGITNGPSLAYVRDEVVAIIGFESGVGQVYSEAEFTPTSFQTSSPQPLAGDLLPAATSINRLAWASSATTGKTLMWPQDGGGTTLYLIVSNPDLPEVPLSQVVSDELLHADLTTADFDTSALTDTLIGFQVQRPAPPRNNLELLATYSPFDLVVIDGVMKTLPRTVTVTATIPDEDGRAADASAGDADMPPPYVRTWQSQLDLPKTAALSYADPSRDFQQGSRTALRSAKRALQASTAYLTIAMKGDRAQAVVDTMLDLAWVSAQKVTFALSTKWSHLAPGDVISYRGFTVRVIQLQHSPGLVAITGEPVLAVDYGRRVPVDGEGFQGSRVSPPTATDMILLDLPALGDDDDSIGVYVIVDSADPAWTGAQIYDSLDVSSWQPWVSSAGRATIGVVDQALPPANPAFPDESSVVTVRVPYGTLESVSDDLVLAGQNACLIGNEICQYRSAALTSKGVYTLSGFYRGRRGTERYVATHQAGERFIVLEPSSYDFATLTRGDLGVLEFYQPVTVGAVLGSGRIQGFTATGETMRPLSPAHLEASRDADGNLTLTWIRRARIDAEWLSGSDVPLDEDTEQYLITAFGSAGTAVRTWTQAAQSLTYAAADQTSDFGSVQASISVSVQQISGVVGAGHAVAATL